MFFKNLIITGGAGFIGNNFIRYILKKNIEFNKLFIIDKLSYASHKNNIKDLLDDKRIFFYKVDICAKSTLNKTMQEIIKIAGGTEKLAIIHFAAETHNDNSIDNPPPFVQTNILGTYNLIEIARHNHMRFHHISTDEVFGDLPLNALPKNQKFTDSSPYLPSSPYSATKASSDLLVRAWTRTFGLKATISNCGNNYGPYQHIEKFIPRQITSILENKKPKIYGNGLNVRDWIHVDDHSSAILSILNKGKIGRTYLIGVNGQKNNLEVIKIILQVMNKPSNWFDFVKDRDGHDLRYAIDPSKTMNELGWKPSHLNLKEEIKSVVEWYANNPWFWKHQKEKVEQMYKNRGQ